MQARHIMQAESAHLDIGDGRPETARPVHQAVRPVDDVLVVKTHERLGHSAREHLRNSIQVAGVKKLKTLVKSNASKRFH